VLTFRRLTAGLAEKLEVVVRFLAVLELYKQGLVDLEQPSNVGDLTITWIGGDAAESAGGAWMRALAGVDAYDG
jgi:segregation and condensation protein A